VKASLTVTALGLALAGRLTAQQTGVVYGSVHDTAGRPITAAVVTVLESRQQSRVNAQGVYRLADVSAGPVILEAIGLGFRRAVDTLQLPAGDSVRVDFVLRIQRIAITPDVFRTTPIVVTAAKRAQSLADVVASVVLMPDTEIAKRAVNTVDEAVDRVPGVQFLNGQINIRGSTGYVQGLGARVLLLVDGVPANQGDRGGINWDIVPVDLVERVEVVKGAGSALYGSAALGGVVNLITREIPPGLHARVRVSGGAFADPPHAEWQFRSTSGTQGGATLTASYGQDDLRGALTAGGWHSDGYREQDRNDHWQVAGKGAWEASPLTRVDVSGAWASDQYQTPLVWCERGRCDDAGQAYQPFKVDTGGLGDHTRSDKGYLTATLTRRPNERLRWQLRSSWLRTHFTDFQRSGDDFGIANRYGVEARGEISPAADRVVTVGAEGALSDINSNIFGSHTQSEYAAYGESERHFGAVRLTTGARIDFLTVDGGGLTAVISPRVGAVFPQGSGVWRASAGRGFRVPSLAERFVSTVVSSFVVKPNPGLEPEKAWTFEVGHARPFSPALRLDAAVFWTEARDLIEPSVNPAAVEIQFRNLARARLAGLDLALTGTPLSPRFSASLAYTFLYARELAHDTVPERPLAFRPRHLLTLGAGYTWNAFDVGAEFRYASRFERVELYPADPRVSAKVLDLRAGWTRGPLAARLLVANALNYVYNLVPRTLAPVRTVSVTLAYTY
jgi:iron complex outermembrane receptor protein